MDPRGSHLLADRGDSRSRYRNFCFSNTKTLRDEESMSFPRPFCLVRPARIAIASELLLRRAQQADRCGACAVADGEWCAAHCDGCAVLAVVASRVFRWRQRSQWRVRWGSERAECLEWPPVLRLPTEALLIALGPVPPQGQAWKASFAAKRLRSLPTSLFEAL
jgi:hypothetical protein